MARTRLITSREADSVTKDIVVQILQDEIFHEENLQNIEEDIRMMVKRSR